MDKKHIFGKTPNFYLKHFVVMFCSLIFHRNGGCFKCCCSLSLSLRNIKTDLICLIFMPTVCITFFVNKVFLKIWRQNTADNKSSRGDRYSFHFITVSVANPCRAIGGHTLYTKSHWELLLLLVCMCECVRAFFLLNGKCHFSVFENKMKISQKITILKSNKLAEIFFNELDKK